MSAQPGSALSSDRPFPGLRPFAFEDRDFFFGRETQTYALYRLIVQSRFVAVVGSSGSGKSSLVRAGLLPLLADESDDPGGRKWSLKEMRPGGAPLSRLADTLAELSQDEDPAIAATRRERIEFDLRSSFGIAKVLDKIEGLGGATLLLVVDQFEELFRYAGSGAHGTEGDLRDAMRTRDEAADFVKLLLEASRSPSHHVRVLLTMRSDFIGECARFQGLPDAVSATQFLVPSLTRDQREEIIRDPIEKAGGTIDPTLVQRLLNDSSDDLDQLPVLQHCLLRLWERAGAAGSIAPPEDAAATSSGTNAPAQTAAGGRHLTLEHYESIGRISGALSQHAEEILTGLVGLEPVVERVFRTLAEIDKEGRAIRRALPFAQLCGETGEPGHDVRRVVDRFRADDCSFLVPSLSSAPRLEPDTRIDVGHEALLRRWERRQGMAASRSTRWRAISQALVPGGEREGRAPSEGRQGDVEVVERATAHGRLGRALRWRPRPRRPADQGQHSAKAKDRSDRSGPGVPGRLGSSTVRVDVYELPKPHREIRAGTTNRKVGDGETNRDRKAEFSVGGGLGAKGRGSGRNVPRLRRDFGQRRQRCAGESERKSPTCHADGAHAGNRGDVGQPGADHCRHSCNPWRPPAGLPNCERRQGIYLAAFGGRSNRREDLAPSLRRFLENGRRPGGPGQRPGRGPSGPAGVRGGHAPHATIGGHGIRQARPQARAHVRPPEDRRHPPTAEKLGRRDRGIPRRPGAHPVCRP